MQEPRLRPRSGQSTFHVTCGHELDVLGNLFSVMNRNYGHEDLALLWPHNVSQSALSVACPTQPFSSLSSLASFHRFTQNIIYCADVSPSTLHELAATVPSKGDCIVRSARARRSTRQSQNNRKELQTIFKHEYEGTRVPGDSANPRIRDREPA